jgi:RND family efflux transporter MFP subunit
MIVALLAVYLVILIILVKLRIVAFNLFWKVSPVIVFLLLLIGLFIPMGWGAPQGPAGVLRQSVQIVPNVAGQVIDVPVEPNTPLKAGDILFRIDPAPYQAQVQQIQAQVKLAQINLERAGVLEQRQAGTLATLQQRQAEVDQLQAQLEGAKYNLEHTTVRAPADGYVTNVALRRGARVANLPLAPAMAFIDTSETIVGVYIPQINTRYIAPGQKVELTFKFLPGQILTGRVEAVLQAISTGQVQSGGLAVTPNSVQVLPFAVRVALDDKETAKRLPAGAAGQAAIFTDRVRSTHFIRRIILRQVAILNYVNPF